MLLIPHTRIQQFYLFQNHMVSAPENPSFQEGFYTASAERLISNTCCVARSNSELNQRTKSASKFIDRP